MHDICSAMGIEWSVIREIITTPQEDSHLEPLMGLNRDLVANVCQRNSGVKRTGKKFERRI